MKKHQNAQEELREMYNAARSQGKAHTQKEFAELVGIHPANLSAIFNGAMPITEAMMQRITNAAKLAGILQNGDNNTIAGGDVLGDSAQKNLGTDIQPLIGEMAAQREMYAAHVDRLLGIIEKMQTQWQESLTTSRPK